MLDDLKRDEDGGITLYIQHESPGKAKESNRLPAPDGPLLFDHAPLLAQGGSSKRHVENVGYGQNEMKTRILFCNRSRVQGSEVRGSPHKYERVYNHAGRTRAVIRGFIKYLIDYEQN